MLMNMLHRSYLDANRKEPEATGGIPKMKWAYRRFMQRAQSLKEMVESECGHALWIDVHGHNQNNLVMLGYDLNEKYYDVSDEKLDSTPFYYKRSTIQYLSGTGRVKFSRLIRGVESFGTFLGKQGIGAVPSLQHPRPEEIQGKYLDGAVIVNRFGSKFRGTVDAVQMEIPTKWRLGIAGKRSRKEANQMFAAKAARAVVNFFRTAYAINLRRLGKRACGNGNRWKVIEYKSETDGIRVREYRSLTSTSLGRLGKHAVVEEIERFGNRLHFQLLSGEGPKRGWVSLRYKGHPLLRATEEGPRQQQMAAGRRKPA